MVEVTSEDWDAAQIYADLYSETDCYMPSYHERIGQAFARHRIAAEQRGKLEGARLAIEEISSITSMLSEKCACEIKRDAFRSWAGIIAALDPAKIVGEGRCDQIPVK